MCVIAQYLHTDKNIPFSMRVILNLRKVESFGILESSTTEILLHFDIVTGDPNGSSFDFSATYSQSSACVTTNER